MATNKRQPTGATVVGRQRSGVVAERKSDPGVGKGAKERVTDRGDITPVGGQTATNQRTASLFRNGRNQALRIPVEFEMPGNEVLITKTGERLVIEPKTADQETWEGFLKSLEAFPDFPDIERGPASEIKL